MLLTQIQHFLRHGVLLGAARRPLKDPSGELQRLLDLYEAARCYRGSGFVQVEGQRWQLFHTVERRLCLQYGQLQPSRLLEVRLAPDGTARLRVTDPPREFSQRLYVAADRLVEGPNKASAAFRPFSARIPHRSRSKA